MRVTRDRGRAPDVWLIGAAAACGTLSAGGAALLLAGAPGRSLLQFAGALAAACGLYLARRHREPGLRSPGERAASTSLAKPGEDGARAAPEDRGGFGDRLHLGVAAEGESAAREADAASTPLPEVPPDGPTDVDEARREIYALYDIAQTLGSSLRLTEILDLVVSKIGQLVPYRTCAVYLRDEQKGSLTARLASGDNAAALRGRMLAPGDGITGWAAAQGQTRLSNHPEADLAGVRVDPRDYSTVAAFPLCHDTAVLGVITLYFPRGAGCRDSHLRLMDVIAKLSAGAVFHSSLFEGGAQGSPIDELTDLPTARHLTRFFEQERIRSAQSGRPLALLVLNLDDFRGINERFGHRAGDRYLADVSRVLRNHLRHRDIIVRMSGDEFAVLLPATGFAAAALLAGRLQHAVDLYSLKLEEGGSARAGLSAGVALYPQDGEALEDLLPRADANMYLNKKARKHERANPSSNVIRFPTQSPGR